MATNKSQVTTIDDSHPITAAAQIEESAVLTPTASGVDVQLSGKKKVITIHPTEGDGGSDAVFLQINGYGYQVPRGKPVEVPVELVEILENAKQTTMSRDNKGALIERTTPRFAYSVH